MDVSDDEGVLEGFHSIAEYVAADGLDDILHELRPVGFNSFPFLGRANAFIGDGFSAELIGTEPEFHICKPASGGELDEEHFAFVKELDTAHFYRDPLCDCRFDGVVNIPPKG